MSKLFISHSSQDDAFVRELRYTLADLKQEVWIDSRELRAGDPLWPEIQKAIEESSAVAVVLSPNGHESKWLGKELKHALAVQKQRGSDKFKVFVLSLDGTKLGVLEALFDDEPLYIPVSSAAGGVEAAMNPILVAMGKRLPAEVAPQPEPTDEPLEELVLELTDLKFHEREGVRRPSARARLIYEPSTTGQREVASPQTWRLIAPIGPIEAGELRWYLEQYAIWPSHYFQDRARKVEANLVQWGCLLHDVALPAAQTGNVMAAWATISSHAGRRFSVHVDASVEAGTPEDEAAVIREAATLLLGLPWELLNDGDGYLFQGAKPTRVRRRLPNTRNVDVSVVAAPIRVLLVTARPEDDACGYIDHRASALPLVEAMEELGGLVRLHVLSPPTFDALGKELKRAFDAREPYHVVHFDGHGVYDRRVGLGGLCFEDPSDTDKLDRRRHVTVHTDKLGPLLKDYRIPLVFLEACQTAQAEDTSDSVASELLQRGVASVVAMSHSVLVETARRFVESFYAGLAHGQRVGDAMLAGQRALKDDSFRGRIFGAGELRLEDWFVPVLFQEKDDPKLFRRTTAPQTQEDLRTILASRLGALPAEPHTGFVGRSRELLALQRLLRHERYAVVRGQGGEGKTTLAAEFARWMVRSHQVRRVAFVSVETHSHQLAVLDALGSQLVGEKYSAATFSDVEQALLPIERALREQATLIVVDNMESILLPPYLETPEALTEEAGRELQSILALCDRLLKVGDTRLVFTSREALPAPFDAPRHRRELHRLAKEDAVKLVERALNVEGSDAGATLDAARESIEALVDAVNGHARTLALLAPELRSRGVDATREALVELMADMEQRFPGNREHSLFASVELSLRRMSPENRERARVLGVFHGTANIAVVCVMMHWQETDVSSMFDELVEVGLATPNRFKQFTLNPALCPYLRNHIEDAQHESPMQCVMRWARWVTGFGKDDALNELSKRWEETMGEHVKFLMKRRNEDPVLSAALTELELPNLFALLESVRTSGDLEKTIGLANSLFFLLQRSARPRLLERLEQARDAADAAMGDAWNHVQFDSLADRVEDQLSRGNVRMAYGDAQELLRRARATGEATYEEASFDLATACRLMARVLAASGSPEHALVLLDEAQKRFEAVEQRRPGAGADREASTCNADRGDFLCDLGRLDDAVIAYTAYIQRAAELGNARDVACGKGSLGAVRKNQQRYREALDAFIEARDQYAAMGDLSGVAVYWHQIGMVMSKAGKLGEAEDAYRESLKIKVRLQDFAGQASTLNQLGNLYDDLGRYEEAANFLHKAAEMFGQAGDHVKEVIVRSNLSDTLSKLHR